jgi:hypothetical protein
VNGLGLAAAAIAGLGGGFVNTLAGSGSMIMVPALMVAGVPADLANATSRVPSPGRATSTGAVMTTSFPCASYASCSGGNTSSTQRAQDAGACSSW